MENASKALVMAGGILLSVLILGLAVMVFRNISDLEGIKQDSEAQEQALEFNKRYEMFIRDGLYGSEVVSAANQMSDYNRRESLDQGYEEIQVEVVLIREREIVDAQYFRPGTYNTTQILNAYHNLEDDIKSYMNIKYANGKSIDYFITLRTNELNQLIRQYGEGDTAGKVPTQARRTAYQAVKDEMTFFKRKIFDCTNTDYAPNGRIRKMVFTERN